MLWAVTSYFNPAGYRRKLDNYRTFRANLRVPLAAVELSYSGRFELAPGDADLLLQLHGRDVMWQKERLLNIGIGRLPRDCECIAWLDCDVLFERPDWAEAAVGELRKSVICQLYREVIHLTPQVNAGTPSRTGALHRFESFAFAYATGMKPAPHRSGALVQNIFRPGHAWCARREVLELHGLYDRSILGGGDAVVAYAATGQVEVVIDYQSMSVEHGEDCRRWAAGFARATAGAVSFLDGDILHLWHGDLADRQYIKRREILRSSHYDPTTDIALDSNGCWRWSSPKHEMHRRIREYFETRHEDGGSLEG